MTAVSPGEPGADVNIADRRWPILLETRSPQTAWAQALLAAITLHHATFQSF